MIKGHGDDYQGELEANFSSNVWYGAENTALNQHLCGAIHKIIRYPEADAASLKLALSEKNKIYSSQIIVCNGSTEAFYLIAQAYAGCNSMIVTPTFSEYADACKMHLHNVIMTNRSNLDQDISIYQPDLIWMCNPNNPDGYCFSSSYLKNLIAKYPHSVFIIDQAYTDFTFEETLLANEVNNFANLILIQSLTKRHAIPGLRLGYMMASEKLILKLKQFLIPWSVNTLAIEAGKFITESKYSEFSLTKWIYESKVLQLEINNIGSFELIKSQTPYFLVKLKKGTAKELKAYLLEHKILIRDATNFEGLQGEYIRICAQASNQNELLTAKLKEWTHI